MPRREDPTRLALSDTDRVTLEKWSRQRTGPAARVLRARILLDCAEGLPASEVRGRQQVSEATVRKWRRRFVMHGLDGLRDDQRSGRPRTLTETVALEVLTRTVRSCPPGTRAHWTTRTMAEAAGVSQTAVSRIWRGAGLDAGTVRTCRALNALEAQPVLDDLVGAYANPARAAFAFLSDATDAGGSSRRVLDVQTDEAGRAPSFIEFLRRVYRTTPSGLPIRLLLWDGEHGRDDEVFAWLRRHSRVDVWPIPAPAWWGRLLVPEGGRPADEEHRRIDWDKAGLDFAEITSRGVTSAAVLAADASVDENDQSFTDF